MNTNKALLILALTCAHCGRQRYFNGDGIDAFQLMHVNAQPCNHCGQWGAAVIMISNGSPLPFDLEALPTSIRSPVMSRSKSSAAE
jgi:hypothetical protein